MADGDVVAVRGEDGWWLPVGGLWAWRSDDQLHDEADWAWDYGCIQ